MFSFESFFKQYSLRNTAPRRAVVKVLLESKIPLTIGQIYTKAAPLDATLNLTTVYRIIEKLTKLHAVHVHQKGGVSLCALPSDAGHHVLLSCRSCGVVEECADSSLCKQEHAIASKHGFSSIDHVSELVGICPSCS